jgi:hypothetical protein
MMMLRWDECKISASCMLEEEGIGNRSLDDTSDGSENAGLTTR